MKELLSSQTISLNCIVLHIQILLLPESFFPPETKLSEEAVRESQFIVGIVPISRDCKIHLQIFFVNTGIQLQLSYSVNTNLVNVSDRWIQLRNLITRTQSSITRLSTLLCTFTLSNNSYFIIVMLNSAIVIILWIWMRKKTNVLYVIPYKMPFSSK